MSLSTFSAFARRKFFSALVVVVALTPSAMVGFADQPPVESKLFPANVGSFRLVGRITVSDKESMRESLRLIPDPGPSEVLQVFVAETAYVSANGEKLLVTVDKFENDSAAYSDFTLLRQHLRAHGTAPLGQLENIGTASAQIPPSGLTFFKGATLVTIRPENGKDSAQITELARLFALTLDRGEGDIPVLVKHLPNWETVQGDDVYSVSANSLRYSIPNQAILKEVSFEGGTEAVVGKYGQSQLVIVEFTTPQFSVDNDRRITAKIQELKNQGQPIPTAYRRVGNYSVFVFNAPDEKTASDLVDQVKYEQVVQWLGDDPYLFQRIERYLAQKTSGVVIAVLESSGLSLLLCLGIGGLFGALLFRRRRARQRQAEAYSDAGGMVRLNLDEMVTGDHGRLLEGPNEKIKVSLKK